MGTRIVIHAVFTSRLHAKHVAGWSYLSCVQSSFVNLEIMGAVCHLDSTCNAVRKIIAFSFASWYLHFLTALLVLLIPNTQWTILLHIHVHREFQNRKCMVVYPQYHQEL